MAPLLEVRDVTKRFGGVVAVADVSLGVERGEVLGVIGPNGAGKTTLLGLVAGGHRPSSGEINFDGHRVDRLSTHRVARLGVGRTYQTPRPFTGMTVRENLQVAAAGGRRGRSGPDVDEILAVTGLAGEAGRPAGALTLLALKRLELARALALAPGLLLLDEIGAGLTAPELRRLLDLLAAVRSLGVTMVVIEHVIDFIMEVADRVVVMDMGHVRASGTPEEVARDPVVIDAYLGVDREPAAAAPPAAGKAAGSDGAETAVMASAAVPTAAAPGRNSDGPPRALVEVRDLHVSYAKVRALNGVSLSVREGEAVAVLGPNGAGKSTLCRALMGLVRPAGGAVLVDGEDVTTWATERRVREARMALCPEGRHVFADQSVVENLELGAVAAGRRAREERLDSVLALFPELAERTRQQAGTLSGGQQQMLAIGRSLMADPRLLVVDELSLGLTPQVAMRIYDSLRLMLARGLTLVVVEQHVGEALEIAEEAYVMERGNVVFRDTARHIRGSKDELAEIYVRATGGVRPPEPGDLPSDAGGGDRA